MSTKLRFSKKVKEAVKAHRPILALESTIIAHGMPYPNNIEFAIKAESSCLEIGVTPATVAIINGEVCVGLERLMMALTGTENIRDTTFYPRDVDRLTP